MENEIQLILGKYVTQMRTSLLKREFTQIRTALPQETNHVQSPLHHVNVFCTCFQTLCLLRRNGAFNTNKAKQDFSGVSLPHPTLSMVVCLTIIILLVVVVVSNKVNAYSAVVSEEGWMAILGSLVSAIGES